MSIILKLDRAKVTLNVTIMQELITAYPDPKSDIANLWRSKTMGVKSHLDWPKCIRDQPILLLLELVDVVAAENFLLLASVGLMQL